MVGRGASRSGDRRLAHVPRRARIGPTGKRPHRAPPTTFRRLALLALSLAAAGGLGFLGGEAAAQQRGVHPDIGSAEGKLREALADLNRAPEAFGGHKQRAINRIKSALTELRLAERFR